MPLTTIFSGLLALIFITLKLTHFIMWSWWLVLLPFVPVVLSADEITIKRGEE